MPWRRAGLMGIGGARWVEKAVHEDKVEPAAEFVTDLAKMSDARKPQPLVKSIAASFAASIPPIITCFPSARAHESRASARAPDAGAATVVPHMDGVLDRITISGPCPSPLAKRLKAKSIAAGIERLSKSRVAPEGDAPEFDQQSGAA